MSKRMTAAGTLTAAVALTIAIAAAAAPPPVDFSGTWVFNPSKSTNIGMMSAAELVSTITQTATAVVVRDDSSMDGAARARETRYDLTGASVSNESPLGDAAHTTSRWAGKTLVTTWTSMGAVAGTTVVRTETRSLSPDGKTMYLQSARGDAEPMVIVFDRR